MVFITVSSLDLELMEHLDRLPNTLLFKPFSIAGLRKLAAERIQALRAK